MNRFYFYAILIATAALFFSCSGNKYKVKNQTDSHGYKYEYVTGDPLKAKIYTLKNGLKVYLTVNKDEPRIQGFITIKAGSTYDPQDNTGLAHYLEHLMFKGTSRIGTSNWEKERPLLDQLSVLFEEHKNTSDPLQKKLIYAKIDSVSQVAAQYAIANEYDKICQTLGAKGTNAYTTNERTVYVNDIPSNELEKWLIVEKERFSTLVLRIFHTELETVYEEFNISQDNDARKEYYAFLSAMFPSHPYGQQTTLGKAEHLKNPSMVNIQNYWSTYYVPNNMAICLSGDFDPENAIQLIDKCFGQFPEKTVPEKILPKEEPISKPQICEVFGPAAEDMIIGWRIGGDNSPDQEIATLISAILSNSQAGLIDLNLVQQQKTLEAGAYTSFYKEYGIFGMYGSPREGQSLEQLKDLLVEELIKLKKGDFDDWLIKAVINDMRLKTIQSRESNERAHEFVECFGNNVPWNRHIDFYDRLDKITKQQIVDFANINFTDTNYVLVYKRIGKDENVVKVEKPQITAVPLNRTDKSEFMKSLDTIKTERISPVFVDFQKEILMDSIYPGVTMNYIKNSSNELFMLYVIIEMGKNTDKLIPIAVNYLPYLGTDKYSAAELQKEFFKLGLNMQVFSGDQRCYVSISGLESSAEKGIELLEHVLTSVKPDQKALDDYIAGINKERANNKINKRTILWWGMMNYGIYGPSNPYTNVPSTQELSQIKPEQLTDILKSLYTYKHRILYYGQNDFSKVKDLISNIHKINGTLKDVPAQCTFTEQSFDKPKVFVVDFDMVQSNVVLVAPDCKFDLTLIPYASMFNEFYSNLVYQDIRESKGLAYSTFTQFTIPDRPNKMHRVQAFVGTQPDKLRIATDAMKNIMNAIPEAQSQFDASRESIMKQIESERIIKDEIFWTYVSNLDKGIKYDIRKDTYSMMQTITYEQFTQFFNTHIKGKNFSYLILANKNMLDKKLLNNLGDVNYLSLEQIFNY